MPSKIDFPRNKRRIYKGTRLGTLVLFLGTILLSCILWFKTQAQDFWQSISGPAVYKIGKASLDLDKILGIKPNLQSPETLKESLNLLVKDLKGTYGIYVYVLKQKQTIGINEDQVFQAASVAKIPILVSFYEAVDKGKLSEEQEYRLAKADVQDYGAGSMRYASEGASYSLGEVARLMAKESDNTAAWILQNLVGQDKIIAGLKDLKMERTSWTENTTTPREMGGYLVKLYQNELTAKSSTEKILNDLEDTDFEDRIPKGVPDNVEVAHKIGNEIQVYNDCGIILGSKPYVLCILTGGVVEEEALTVLPKISRLVWEYVNR